MTRPMTHRLNKQALALVLVLGVYAVAVVRPP